MICDHEQVELLVMNTDLQLEFKLKVKAHSYFITENLCLGVILIRAGPQLKAPAERLMS